MSEKNADCDINQPLESGLYIFSRLFQGSASFVDHFAFNVCRAFLSFHCSIVVTCCETADLLACFYVKFYCVLSLSHVVSWVRCGVRLYRFLIFASLLTIL